MKLQAFQRFLPEIWAGLALPEVRSLIPQLPHDCLAVGADEDGCPVGLAIVRRDAGDDTAHLISLVVARNFRHKGVAGRLLDGLASLLKPAGIRLLAVEYMEPGEEQGPIGSFFRQAGFAPPSLNLIVWSGPMKVMDELDWVHSMPLPEPLSVRTWSELTESQHAYLAAGEDDWYPSMLSPFADAKTLDSSNSLLLLDGEQAVGWMVVEPLDMHTLAFKSMFVQQTYRRKGRGIALMAEAFRRFLSDGRYTEGVFCVEADNSDMRKFLQRRVVHPSAQREGMWRTFKWL